LCDKERLQKGAFGKQPSMQLPKGELPVDARRSLGWQIEPRKSKKVLGCEEEQRVA
jgi:hypothetical protein